jgi:hypothetical protein
VILPAPGGITSDGHAARLRLGSMACHGLH